MGVVVLGCIFMPRYYRASAYVMPSETALSKPVIPGTGFSFNSNAGGAGLDPRRKADSLATFVGLAEMAAVRQKAIDSLELGFSPAELEKMVKVEPTAGSIIRITALDRTRTGAIRLANAIAHEFSAYYREITSRQAQRNREFLEGELAQAATGCEKTKADLQTFKSQAGEAALPAGSAQNPFLTQFYALRAEMDATRSQLRAVEGRLRAARVELARQPQRRETETSTSDNPAVDQLQTELAKLEGELEVARIRYTEKHKVVRDLKARIADVGERLEREQNRMITRRTVGENPIRRKLQDESVEMETERASLRSRLASLASAMDENERRAGELADSSVVLLTRTREYETAQERYDRLRTMLDEARVEEKVSATQGEIQIVDDAKSAVGPVTRRGPSPLQLLLLGLVLSTALGLGIALALAFLDDRLESREDLHRGLDLPVPAVIPELPTGIEGIPVARITELQPLSAHAESYRFLRTELMLGSGNERLKTLMVATAKPGQGGTTTAVNLAVALAEVGKRVVLVDADLRRPGLHKFFGESNEAGLTSLLSNGSQDASHALRKTNLETLVLLPAGPPADNPAALLGSPRMRQIMARLREHADYVVIDTPSAATFADAAMLGPLVDGVIIVTRAKQSLREVDLHTKELFGKVGANVIGAVLNDAVPETVESFYFHHHYYPTSPALPPGDGDARASRPAIGDGESETPAGALSEPSSAFGQSESDPESPPESAETSRAALPGVRRWRMRPLFLGGIASVVILGLLFYLGMLPSLAGRDGGAIAAGIAERPSVTVEAFVKQPT
ncbi:MAG: polysaccharide biosynthesis tyrosine autokinase, partial [Armatimonadota bacterium]|nr:polysaccharide biosynthesis tyrosine autokinase [Armatimonadota bacterium]